jgi:hypothetical protein
MSRRALIHKLKTQAAQVDTDDTVRQISRLIDELSAAVVDGEPYRHITLTELMETPDVPKSTQG